MAHLILPRFPRADVYCEPFFGGGGMFFGVPKGMYPREVVNDKNKSLVTFFRCLRDRREELESLCKLTPTARDEFAECLKHSDNELEEARRVFVRLRQGFSGKHNSVGNWRRSPGGKNRWPAQTNAEKADQFQQYADRLSLVMIDNIDAVEFIGKWASGRTFFYCDPPYVHTRRVTNGMVRGCQDYEHELGNHGHELLADALHQVVANGCLACVSGYNSDLYNLKLFKGWRKHEFEVALHSSADQEGKRRTEVLWMSYPEEEEIGYVRHGQMGFAL